MIINHTNAKFYIKDTIWIDSDLLGNLNDAW